jgi:hypothetical protein
MAIKISGTTVIDDSRNATNIVNLAASGTISLNSITYPSSDGTTGQALVTNGSGTLSFGSAGISTGKAIAMAIVFG